MRSCFCKIRWNRIRMRSHLHEMRSVFHEMKWDRIRMKASSREMKQKIFSWDEMKSNLCKMRASDLMSSQNWNQNKTRSWWNESSHSDSVISLVSSKVFIDYHIELSCYHDSNWSSAFQAFVIYRFLHKLSVTVSSIQLWWLRWW